MCMPLGGFRLSRIIAWIFMTLWDNRPGTARRKRREALAEADRLRDEATRACQRERDMRELEVQQFHGEFAAWWARQGVK